MTLVYLIAIAYVWSRGSIFRPVRELGKGVVEPYGIGVLLKGWRSLAGCPLCSGVWIGILGQIVACYYPWSVAALGRACIVGVGAFWAYCLFRGVTGALETFSR